MNNRWKKLVVVFITVLTLGSALFPIATFAQDGQAGSGPLVGNEGAGSGAGNIPPSTETPGQGQTLQQTGSTYQDTNSPLPACSIMPNTAGTFEGCFVRLFYYALLYPSAWIAGIAGQIFDYFIAYTLNSDSYSSGGFVEQGWRVVRDIANASFIFVLLYTAIIFIVKQDSPSMTRTLTRVILIAIVINFSLFMTRAIIDAGNILGRVFYEKTIINNDDLGEQNKYKTISAGLIEKVAPQKLLTPNVFTKTYKTSTTENTANSNSFGGAANDSDNDLEDINGNERFTVGSGFMILIILVASIVNIAIAWIFVSVSIFLIARTLGLWMMMIMSPVAFATVSIPFVTIKGWGFSEWIKKTVSLSFMVVVFMFFLYLTVMFLDIGLATAFNINSTGGEMSTIHWIMSVIVPLMAILFLLNMAKSQAKSMAGEFGGMVGNALGVASKLALGGAGLALGGAAIAGRQLGGRLGANMAANANTATAMGRFKKRTGKYLSTASFDARNMKIPKPIGNTLQSGLSYATDGYVKPGDINFGKGTDKGGYATRRQAFVDRKMKDAEALAPNEDVRVKSASYKYKDAGGNMINGTVNNISESEAKMALERKKYQVKNDPDNEYGRKSQDTEDARKEFEKQEKLWKDAKRQKEEGIITDIQATKIKKEYTEAKETKEAKEKELKKVEGLWKKEEAVLKGVQESLGEMKAEHYRSYSKAVNSFDPRNRANDASDTVEKKAYDQDKKNETSEKKNK